MILTWIHNPHAGFVLAAYAVAAVALIGLALVSGCAYRRLNKEWRLVSQDRADPKQ